MPRSLLAVVPPLLALAGCIGTGVEDPFESTLQGTWSSCSTDGTADTRERVAFGGDAIEWTTSSHATADGSCGGAEAVTSHVAGAFTASELVNATLGGARVVARGLDVTDASRTFYTTVYLDEAATPRRLHLGIADPASGRDMTSGAKRPVVLDATPLVQP